jgi:hypothetical protein
MASPLKKPGIFLDWNDDYKGKTGNGWDHGSTGKMTIRGGNNAPSIR